MLVAFLSLVVHQGDVGWRKGWWWGEGAGGYMKWLRHNKKRGDGDEK